MQRTNDRPYNKLRSLNVTYDMYANAAGSTLFEMGSTKVLSAVTLQSGVPHFLRGKGAGWLTAEYSMLPASTPVRTIREVTSNKRSGRTIEISRLIGRALRAVVDLSVLGENTLFIDCDVLQADGGTRTACIVGAYLALKAAEIRWLESGLIDSPIITDEVAAVSVGLSREGRVLLDIDYAEDSVVGADFNFVLTRSGGIVEMQCTAETKPFMWSDYDKMRALALEGVDQMFQFFDTHRYHTQRSQAMQASSTQASFLKNINFSDIIQNL